VGALFGIVIVGHGQFATGLRSVVEMIAGDQPAIEYVSFHPSDSVDDLQARIREAVSRVSGGGDGVLFLVDLVGGSPFQASATVASQHGEDAVVIAGANVPMILELVMRRDTVSLREAVRVAVETGRSGIVRYEAAQGRVERE